MVQSAPVLVRQSARTPERDLGEIECRSLGHITMNSSVDSEGAAPNKDDLLLPEPVHQLEVEADAAYLTFASAAASFGGK